MSATRPTIRDVAAAAGVSVTTVSHALNEKGRIDAETRSRVIATAQRLGFRPNRAARNLRGGRTQVIALLLPEFGNEPHNPALSLENYLRMAGTVAVGAHTREYALLLVPPRVTRENLRDVGIDGAIVVDPVVRDARVQLLEELDIPFSMIERDAGRDDLPWHVSLDADAAMESTIEHLETQGAGRVCLLVPDVGWAYALNAREAFRAAVARHDLKGIVVPVGVGGLEHSAYDAAALALDAARRPDAIIALAGPFAAGVARAASERGLHVPDDLLLVSGADSVHARAATPAVSALDMQPEECGTQALDMLLELLGGHEPRAPRVVDYPLHVRASSLRRRWKGSE
jgi:DNA-binding LacI/PurR family transcriptional regulator